MKESIEHDGQDFELGTVTVGALETITLDDKKGRAFNIALVAASLLSAGDTEHGTEEWVRTLPAFGPEGENPPFQSFLGAANRVNGFKAPTRSTQGEPEPAAPAAA